MMTEKWHFQTQNLTVFTASKKDVRTSTWSGSSTWNNRRWVRDEARPEEVDYYIKTVTWRPDSSITETPTPAPPLDAPEDRFKVTQDSTPSLSIGHLLSANVPPGTAANEAKTMVRDFRLRMGYILPYNPFNQVLNNDEDSEDEDEDVGDATESSDLESGSDAG